ncbi:hypothetical protein QR680_016377 [Steinernema hermaphroditum]|uniref:Uncharacterized protein n=1 Tax=Steinernema hermaphroditum TaxID=289476 RepID=A0AA39HD74_9BILA|nr:hypothetical protein QR680_016377 [Steinernema hermaphroditum]
MDLLSCDLVDHLVQLLHRTDLETIIKVAEWRPELSNWQLMAEHHLEERYLLDVRVYIPSPKENEPESAPKRMKLEEEEEIEGKNEEIQVFVEKCRFTGELVGSWDFRRLQYASLRDVTINSYHWEVNRQHRPCEMKKLLSILSLPVATRDDSIAGSSLSVRSGYHWISDNRDSRVVDLALQMIQVVQKTFAKVDIRMSSNGTNLRMEDFMQDYVDQETFVEDMRFSCGFFPETERICQKGVVTLFKDRRRTPLTVQLPDNYLTYHNIQEILEHWKNSDGYVADHKELHMRMPSYDWPTLRWEWRGYHDYLPHPSKRSSLLLSINFLKIVKFEPWHSPVDYDWIDSVINDWKARAGMHFYGGNRQIKLLTTKEDWDKLELKYGPLMMKTTGEHLPLIAHSSNLASIELRKYRNCYSVIAETKIKKLKRTALESFISEWMDGSGDFVVGQLRKATVGLVCNVWRRISDSRQAFYVHPWANSRLKIQPSRGYGLYTMSLVPIDPETVKDWNLNLLFGAE